MAELTREYLDKQFGKLATKNDIKDVKDLVKGEVGRLDKKIDVLATTVDEKIDSLADSVDEKIDSLADSVDEKIDALATVVDEKIDALAVTVDEKIDGLARMVANGFEEIKSELNVRKEVESLNYRMTRIEQSLNIKQ